MTTYYRVKQDTFLWKKGAIISRDKDGHYKAIEDIWDATPAIKNEYISAPIIEADENAQFFERVYQDNLSGKIFRTKDQLIEVYNNAFQT